MTTADPFQKSSMAAIQIVEVAKWTKQTDGSRLFLPPIQRSAVWRNSQIINYWDSLVRGYPAGLMMVHRPKKDLQEARTSDGATILIREHDFQLFDGQQRLTAILLGLGEGQLKARLKLWVDFGIEKSSNSDLLFGLRISSTGQPFGYQTQSPNEKFPLYKRREKTEEWMKLAGLKRLDSKEAFAKARGTDLIDAQSAVPFQEIAGLIQGLEPEETIATLQTRYPKIPVDRLEDFVRALKRALNTPVLFQLIDQVVIENEDEYIRFFGRLGQGGTALTNDELTYSIIKHHFPKVHDRMREITEGPAGRVAGEVNLVLAALRVAKVSAPWNDAGDWQIFGRPQPAFVSRLREQLPGVRDEFQRLIPPNPGGRLKELLESIRRRLEYDKASNPSGLPVILLARLPHELVDVLILMESRHEKYESTHFLPAFVLYWLLFVGDAGKGANLIFQRFCLKEAEWQPRTDGKLIRFFEEQGISRHLPSLELLRETRDEVRHGNHALRPWGDRFAVLDANREHPTGSALRVLTTNGELIRRTLLWLQRDYLTGQFPDYDPTSNRDEDLPIDLDHLIPHKKFGADWRLQRECLAFQDDNDNFRTLRGTVGNSLGNFRWLDASDNRSRKADKINVLEGDRDFIADVAAWNAMIEKKLWSQDDVASFQKIIDLRSLDIYEKLLVQGGLAAFVSTDDSGPKVTTPVS
jgi:hypothetical protein